MVTDDTEEELREAVDDDGTMIVTYGTEEVLRKAVNEKRTQKLAKIEREQKIEDKPLSPRDALVRTVNAELDC